MDFHWTGVASEGSHHLDEIRRQVQERMDGVAPGNADLWRIIQAIDELASNCMRHAYGLGVEGPIRVHIEYRPPCVSAVVEDVGQPFEGPLERALDLGPNLEGRFGGLGLALTRLLVNEMTYERAGTTNRWRVMLDLSKPPRTNGKAPAVLAT